MHQCSTYLHNGFSLRLRVLFNVKNDDMIHVITLLAKAYIDVTWYPKRDFTCVYHWSPMFILNSRAEGWKLFSD